MKTFRLLPGRFKIIGLILAIPGIVLGIMCLHGGFEFEWLALKIRGENELFLPAVENFTNEVAFFLVLTGLMFIAFSREKEEDERVQQIRLEAFQWSFLVHFSFLQIANWLTYSEHFFFILMYSMFTPLLVFIGRFYYVLKVKESGFLREKEEAI